VSPPPSAAGPPPGSEEPPVSAELPATPPSWPGCDCLGLTQAIGGLAIGLIALCSSYDHLIFAGRNIPIPQQWGIPLIAASVAIVFSGCVQYGAPLGREAQLATRSRLQAAEDAARAADETTRERHLASEERQRAGKERTKLIEKETEQIKKETEQLKQMNAKERALSASIKRLCFPPESSSIPQTSIEPDSKPFLPS